MIRFLIFICLCFILPLEFLAQNTTDRAYILSKSNVEQLRILANKFNKENRKAFHDSLSFKRTILNSKGQTGYLSGINEQGQPVYDFEDNVDAAISARIDRIQVGGISGLNLDGAGIEIGQWEAGGVPFLNHQELRGNARHGENASVSEHSTHTAGTMIGKGVEASAKGMAPAATLVSRRSNGDEGELTLFALNGGIISNHSYSTGDPDGQTEEYGVYTSNSAQWDQILYNAPYLTVCKSAGNNRNDGVNTGDRGYDLIYTVAASKNLITIGAVEDVPFYTSPGSIQQSNFSNFGPTDDWRIKPDITTNGISLFSADDDAIDAYTNKSGTSMSAPTTAGAIALLQQYYHQLNNVYMKSATVRALLFCTTDEAGNYDGPDFQSGWGLLNAERAAEAIQTNGSTSEVLELSLAHGEVFSRNIEIEAESAVSLTISWTDLPGNANGSGEDDPSLQLINDLDLRISGDDTTYLPWTLTPDSTFSNFTFAPSKGDNFRDNTERIDINSLPEGEYTITVSHKDSLFSGGQDFSLVLYTTPNSATAIDNLQTSPSFLLYPNPSQHKKVWIRIPQASISENYHVQVFDLQGKLLKSQIAREEEVELDMTAYQVGTYFITVSSSNYFQREVLILSP